MYDALHSLATFFVLELLEWKLFLYRNFILRL